MKRLLFGFLMLLAFSAVSCAPGEEESAPPRTIAVTATDIAFDTERIEVATGETVEVTLNNDGALEHDFSIMHIPVEVTEAADEEIVGHDMEGIEEPELHVAAEPGASNSVTFIPTEPGEYTYLCTVSGHREAGMTGTLVVTAAQ
jgi:uncharacterized cupredoxin-like copper-binding protein